MKKRNIIWNPMFEDIKQIYNYTYCKIFQLMANGNYMTKRF